MKQNDSDYYKDKTQRSIEQNRESRNVKKIYIYQTYPH